SQEVEEGYAFYLYRDEDQRLTFYLISNRNQGNLLLPALKQLDYIMIIEGELTKERKQALLSAIRAIPKVITAFEIRFSELKNHESFLTDIEFHILGINRGAKQNTTHYKPI
ncbi:MAG: IPExxxVDY family protein, partial [Bacteroidota bacterium]